MPCNDWNFPQASPQPIKQNNHHHTPIYNPQWNFIKQLIWQLLFNILSQQEVEFWRFLSFKRKINLCSFPTELLASPLFRSSSVKRPCDQGWISRKNFHWILLSIWLGFLCSAQIMHALAYRQSVPWFHLHAFRKQFLLSIYSILQLPIRKCHSRCRSLEELLALLRHNGPYLDNQL